MRPRSTATWCASSIAPTTFTRRATSARQPLPAGGHSNHAEVSDRVGGGGDRDRAPAGRAGAGGRVGLGPRARRLPPRLPRAAGLLRPAGVRGPAVLWRLLPLLPLLLRLPVPVLRLSAPGGGHAAADRLRAARAQHAGLGLLVLLPGSRRVLSDRGRVSERLAPGRAAHRVAGRRAGAQRSCSTIRR